MLLPCLRAAVASIVEVNTPVACPRYEQTVFGLDDFVGVQNTGT